MSYQRPIVRRYSEAFKYKVVSEIEQGKLSVAEARRMYDIRGSATIRGWLTRLGKNHLLAKVVRIEMKDEPDRLKALAAEKQRLESALAQAQLKIITLESTVEVLEDTSRITQRSAGIIAGKCCDNRLNLGCVISRGVATRKVGAYPSGSGRICHL